ncbi:MAG: DUF2845 domain-containing protein [Desulfobacteraceae bacterium]|nr:DUF2845 domain-containing protein [Desulfobacteraceae bacterium]
MKRIIICIFCLLISTNTAFALRCGNNLISVGDLKNKVRVNCGEPISKEVIGYIDRVESETTNGKKLKKRIRVTKIEEWIIKIQSQGTTYYHSLVFEGNTLAKIKAAGQKNTN